MFTSPFKLSLFYAVSLISLVSCGKKNGADDDYYTTPDNACSSSFISNYNSMSDDLSEPIKKYHKNQIKVFAEEIKANEDELSSIPTTEKRTYLQEIEDIVAKFKKENQDEIGCRAMDKSDSGYTYTDSNGYTYTTPSSYSQYNSDIYVTNEHLDNIIAKADAKLSEVDETINKGMQTYNDTFKSTKKKIEADNDIELEDRPLLMKAFRDEVAKTLLKGLNE